MKYLSILSLMTAFAAFSSDASAQTNHQFHVTLKDSATEACKACLTTSKGLTGDMNLSCNTDKPEDCKAEIKLTCNACNDSDFNVAELHY